MTAMIRPTVLLRLLAVTILMAAASVPICAQDASGLPGSGRAQQTMRPYWHDFMAYGLTIALVLGWVISISRRLKDVEDRLRE